MRYTKALINYEIIRIFFCNFIFTNVSIISFKSLFETTSFSIVRSTHILVIIVLTDLGRQYTSYSLLIIFNI